MNEWPLVAPIFFFSFFVASHLGNKQRIKPKTENKKKKIAGRVFGYECVSMLPAKMAQKAAMHSASMAVLVPVSLYAIICVSMTAPNAQRPLAPVGILSNNLVWRHRFTQFVWISYFIFHFFKICKNSLKWKSIKWARFMCECSNEFQGFYRPNLYCASFIYIRLYQYSYKTYFGVCLCVG